MMALPEPAQARRIEPHRRAALTQQLSKDKHSVAWALLELVLDLEFQMSALTQPIIDATSKLQTSVTNLQSVLPPGSTIAAPSDATDITAAATSISSAADAVQTLAVQLGFVPPATTVSGGAGTDTTQGAAAAPPTT